MDDYLERVRKILLSDSTPRAVLMGGAAILAIVVISDLAGARERAPEVRETLRTFQAEREAGPTVPSVASVPRDLASEARLAARLPEVPDEIVIAESVSEEEPIAEMVEAEVTEETVTDVSEVAEELSETEAAEEPTEELSETEVVEEAIEELAEAEVAEEAIEELAPMVGEVGDLSLLANANIDNGQRVWRQCGACHVYDAEQNRGGPHLVNIIGREIGVAEGWRYSRALSEHGGIWTVEGLLAWLENPDTYIPGNQMAFRGLRNEQDRIDILGFLNANRTD